MNLSTTDAPERLRYFCYTLLRWLDAGGDRAPGLAQGLAGAIGTGTAGLVDSLAREAAAYETAVRDLHALLPASILTPPPSIAALIDELDARRALAERVVEAVRQLGREPEAPARPAVVDHVRIPLPAPKRPARSASGETRHPESDASLYQLLAEADSRSESATLEPTPSRAAP